MKRGLLNITHRDIEVIQEHMENAKKKGKNINKGAFEIVNITDAPDGWKLNVKRI